MVRSDIATKVTVTRRHQPLPGSEREVMYATTATLIARLADDSAMKLPRRWTDANVVGEDDGPGGN